MLNPFKFVHDKEKKLCKLAKKCGRAPENLPTILQNPDIVTLVLKYLKIKDTDDEMPALLFDWNQAGFNDTNVPNCRNGVAGQTQGTIIANILAHGATDFMNKNILFIFRNGQAIGTWHRNIAMNLPWAKCQAGVPDICNNILRLNKITAHTPNVDIEDFLEFTSIASHYSINKAAKELFSFIYQFIWCYFEDTLYLFSSPYVH
ncbi:5412_t:CDS:2, partial [Cetraspora pellucida]